MAPAPADRNLLFGILALQMDFITRDDLIAAMHDWAADKTRPLGQILCDRGALSRARHDLLEALVEEHLAAHGHDPNQSLAAVGNQAACNLSEITKLDFRFGLGSTAPSQRSSANGLETPSPEEAPFKLAPLGSWPRDDLYGAANRPRFRPLRPHARG